MEIGLVPNREKRDPGGLAYWTVSDIAASVKALVAAGGTVVQDDHRRRLRIAGRQRQRPQRCHRRVTAAAQGLIPHLPVCEIAAHLRGYFHTLRAMRSQFSPRILRRSSAV